MAIAGMGGGSFGRTLTTTSDGKDAGLSVSVDSNQREQIYDDGTYTYICVAPYGSALTDAVWGVTRITKADGSSVSSASGQVATNVSTVAALTYNNGV